MNIRGLFINCHHPPGETQVKPAEAGCKPFFKGFAPKQKETTVVTINKNLPVDLPHETIVDCIACFTGLPADVCPT